MGEALFELEQILRSSRYQITLEEEKVLSICKGRALKNFTFTACLASGLTWTALGKLAYAYRINLSGGAGLLSGMWRFDRSLNSCLDNILAMEGSRMQSELANIILTKHRHDPRGMRLIQKHLYQERVFDDSSSDRPTSRWRFRSYFNDGVAPIQRSHDSDTNDTNDTNDDKPNLEVKKHPERGQVTEVTVRPGIELSSDPFDCVFGYSGPLVEIHPSDANAEIAPRRHSHSHKRAQRRRRTRHTEASSDTYS